MPICLFHGLQALGAFAIPFGSTSRLVFGGKIKKVFGIAQIKTENRSCGSRELFIFATQ